MTMLKVRHFFPDILFAVTAGVTQINVASELEWFLIGLRMVAEIWKNEVKFSCFLALFLGYLWDSDILQQVTTCLLLLTGPFQVTVSAMVPTWGL